MIGSFDYFAGRATYSLNLSMSRQRIRRRREPQHIARRQAEERYDHDGRRQRRRQSPTAQRLVHGPDAATITASSSARSSTRSAGDAQAGPAFDNGDFFTVVAAEMTHAWACSVTRSPAGRAARPTPASPTTRRLRDSSGSSTGASIRHLMTSDNGGFQDFGSAVHTRRRPGANINFGGFNCIGSHDQGNPFYEFGRRYWSTSVQPDVQGCVRLFIDRPGAIWHVLLQPIPGGRWHRARARAGPV